AGSAVATPGAAVGMTPYRDSSSLLEIVGFAISFHQSYFTFFSFSGDSVLHTHNALKSFLMDMPENIPVVHFTRGGLVAARIIPNLEIGDLVPAAVDVVDDITFVALHMVHIE